MSRYHSYLQTAAQLIDRYDGQMPFAVFSRDYFSQHRKFGSRDRKLISHLCYACFRIGKAMAGATVQDKILTGYFLGINQPTEFLETHRPDWNEQAGVSWEDKLKLLLPDFDPAKVFPWADQCSEGLDAALFNRSFFIQPDVFLRLRPGQEEAILQKLKAAAVSFYQPDAHSVGLLPGEKIEAVIETDKEAVVQDLSSQRTGDLLPAAVQSVWDCCAASGGKSIMAIDRLGPVKLTVTDIRKSILVNLEQRFRRAGIQAYRYHVTDLAVENFRTDTLYDLVMADVPCTGSGTWSRTPEQLCFFDPTQIDRYTLLQQQILKNVCRAVKPGGYLLYITCSVFRKENEENVHFINEQFHPELLRMELIKGFTKKADTMFAALFRMPLL